jgi:hypothetical protein
MMKRGVAALVVTTTLACGNSRERQDVATAPTVVPIASAPPAPSIAGRDEDAGTPLASDADGYAANLGAFFRSRWSIPATIAPAEAARLCVVFQINVSPKMVIWHVRQDPMVGSGDEAFDESARAMLRKLVDERIPLPAPPPAVEGLYRGRTLAIALAGDLRGDASRCRPGGRP